MLEIWHPQYAQCVLVPTCLLHARRKHLALPALVPWPARATWDCRWTVLHSHYQSTCPECAELPASTSTVFTRTIVMPSTWRGEDASGIWRQESNSIRQSSWQSSMSHNSRKANHIRFENLFSMENNEGNPYSESKRVKPVVNLFYKVLGFKTPGNNLIQHSSLWY